MSPLELLNRQLFLALNAPANTPLWLIHGASVLAEDVILLVPVLLAALWLWGGLAQRSVALKAVLVVMLALGINQLIALGWPHPRPDAAGLGKTWIAHAFDSSFPSDHMTVLSGLGLTFMLDGLRRWGWPTLLAAALVAWARVYLGVHFPLDMLGAVAVVALCWLALTPLWWLLGRPLTSGVETLYRALFAWPILRGWVQR